MIEWYLLTAVIAALIGSFLNVVIYRYPIMLKAQWRAECHEFLALTDSETPPKLNLSFPRSHCPQCNVTIPFYYNIPLLSYLFLLGKCHHCKVSIPFRYFLVELLSVITSLVIVWKFGITLPAAALLIFTWGLIALAFIDIQHYLLPDTITLSILWLGLLCATQNFFVSPEDAIFGALIGYVFLWLIASFYIFVRKKEGMGYGDCKMLGMFGAWLGPVPLLNVIILSCIIALLVSIPLITVKKLKRDQYIPFGPYLALAGWWTMVFGTQMTTWIMKWLS